VSRGCLPFRLFSGAFFGRNNSLGFSVQEKPDRVPPQVRQFLSPELVNRFDEIISFDRLDRGALNCIARQELSRLAVRLKKKEIILEVTEAGCRSLVEHCWQPEYGARPLRRAVERYLEDPLADELLKGALPKSSKITVAIAENALRFQAQAAKAPARRRKKSSE
jgi:ATP-dependent Clp protease ATP-binding subunit ClpA